MHYSAYSPGRAATSEAAPRRNAGRGAPRRASPRPPYPSCRRSSGGRASTVEEGVPQLADVTFADTLEYLRQLPTSVQVECLTAALLEPSPVLQRGALRSLLAPPLRRLEIVVDQFATLLPEVHAELQPATAELLAIAREKIVTGRDTRRLGAYRLVDAFGDLGAAEVLAVGVADPLPGVADVAVAGIIRRLGIYAAARRAAAAAEGAQPTGRDAAQEAAWQAFGTALRRCPAPRCAALCAVLFEFGPVSLSLFRGVLLSQADSPMVRTFVSALASGAAAPAAAFVVALATDVEPPLQRVGQQVLRDRRDRPFAVAVAREVAALRDERTVALARSPRELPWWGPVQHVVATLDAATGRRLCAVLAEAKVDTDKRQAMIEPFLLHPDASVQLAAVQVLRGLRCPGGFAAIAKLLVDGQAAAQRVAAELVIELAPDDRVALLTPLLGSPDAELRRLAVREVSRVSFERYLERFDSMSGAQRRLAANALRKIDAQMLDRVAAEVGALDPSRRLKALCIVDLLGAGKELRQPLLELLDDPDRRVRATAIRIVELAGSVEGVQVLLGALADPDRRVRANAVEAFEELADPRYVQMLVPFVRDRDNRVRANAGKALWNLGWPGARDALLAMLTDGDEMVRLSAVWAIGEVDFPGAREVLQARLASEPAERVRSKLQDALATLAKPTVAP